MNVRDETRHDIHKSTSLRAFMYRDASHLWRSFSHNSTKINIQFLSEKQWKIWRYLVVKPLSSKSEVNGSKTCRFCFICIQNISGSPEDPIATGRFPPLDFSIDFFAYWRSIREEVYSVIDCLHVTGFIQLIFGILVRGEINSSISQRQLLNSIPIKENLLYSSMSS